MFMYKHNFWNSYVIQMWHTQIRNRSMQIVSNCRVSVSDSSRVVTIGNHFRPLSQLSRRVTFYLRMLSIWQRTCLALFTRLSHYCSTNMYFSNIVLFSKPGYWLHCVFNICCKTCFNKVSRIGVISNDSVECYSYVIIFTD